MSRNASLSTALDCPEATVVHVKPTGSILLYIKHHLIFALFQCTCCFMCFFVQGTVSTNVL
jgi:hypothetical protein